VGDPHVAIRRVALAFRGSPKHVFTIRTFEPRDLSALHGLVAELQDFERGIDGRLRAGADMAEEYTAAMLRLCLEQDGAVLVALAHGEVTGFATVRARVPYEHLDDPPGTHALLADLVVSERHRGRGIGHALVEAAEGYAREHGATELRVGVLAGNTIARNLYACAGFTPYLEMLSKRLGDVP
jgi:ribosomal protein S18 acetylase RimI-like enzyme